MSAWGLTAEDYAADSPTEVDVWPDNWETVQVFISLNTQWRMGFSGPTGLDYTAIEPVLRLVAIPTERWPELFLAIRIMERAAIDTMAEQSADKPQ